MLSAMQIARIVSRRKISQNTYTGSLRSLRWSSTSSRYGGAICYLTSRDFSLTCGPA